MTGAMKYLRECREKYGPDDPRTKAAFAARAAEYEAGQEKKPGVWYVSFANEDQFLGGVFVYEESMTGAIQKAHRTIS